MTSNATSGAPAPSHRFDPRFTDSWMRWPTRWSARRAPTQPPPPPPPSSAPVGPLLGPRRPRPRPRHLHHRRPYYPRVPASQEMHGVIHNLDGKAFPLPSYLETDTVFAVKDHLILDFHPSKDDPKAELELDLGYNVTLSPKSYQGKSFHH